MANRMALFLIASILGSVSGAPLAQPVSAPTVSPLTVQAPDPKATERQARSFVVNYAVAANPEIDQIGRWHDPVCVQVTGLPLAEQAAKIQARIEGMAKAQGLPAAPDGCKANVEIVFSDQPQNTIDTVAQRQQLLLGYYHHDKLNQLKTVTHPIQAWYVTATRAEGANTGSMAINGASTMAAAGGASTAFNGAPVSRVQRYSEAIDDPQSTAPVGCVDRFKTCYSSVLYNVLIVADNKALAGKDMNLVADELVMLALSQPRTLDSCNALPSVIEAFAKTACPGRAPPTGLTAADDAYLSALYASAPDAKKAMELSDITARMAKALTKGNTGAAADGGPASAPPAETKGR